MQRTPVRTVSILLSLLLAVALATGCDFLPPTTTPPPSLTLDRAYAANGEIVVATVVGLELAEPVATVAGLDAEIVGAETGEEGSSVQVRIPEGAPGGPQQLTVGDGSAAAVGQVSILADVDAEVLDILVPAGADLDELRTYLERRGYRYADDPEPLGGPGPCGGWLATIEVGDQSLGEALSDLVEAEATDPDLISHVDPRSGWDVTTVDHLGAVGATTAHGNGVGGAGTFIAILDSGVAPHPELGVRLRDDLGASFVEGTLATDDDFVEPGGAPEGHGTPSAVVAAGTTLGVAPEAEVVPVKVCDEQGDCFSSAVVQGVCHAIQVGQDELGGVNGNAEDEMAGLVVNLSLGGSTPTDALEAILAYATSKKVVIAAAAGNQGPAGPTHYPAAYAVDGLVGVAALAGEGLACIDFESRPTETRYVSGMNATFNGIVVGVGDFDAGTTTTSGFAAVSGEGLAGGSDQDLGVNNVLLDFGFPEDLTALSLEYGDYGGTVNLRVNGDLAVVGGIDALPASLGRATVTVIPDFGGEGPTGTLLVRGEIDDVALGGQELWIDEVCPVAQTAWTVASFSTQGAHVDVAAPGVGVVSGDATGDTDVFEGTSIATPQAAGALALLRSLDPAADAAVVAQELIDRAAALPGYPDPSIAVGAGMVDVSGVTP